MQSWKTRTMVSHTHYSFRFSKIISFSVSLYLYLSLLASLSLSLLALTYLNSDFLSSLRTSVSVCYNVCTASPTFTRAREKLSLRARDPLRESLRWESVFALSLHCTLAILLFSVSPPRIHTYVPLSLYSASLLSRPRKQTSQYVRRRVCVYPMIIFAEIVERACQSLCHRIVRRRYYVNFEVK